MQRIVVEFFTRHRHRTLEDAIASAAQESEIAHARSENVHLLAAIAQRTTCEDAAGAGDVLIGRQRGADAIMGRLVEERLMPRQKRRRLPDADGLRADRSGSRFARRRIAPRTIIREHRQPIAQRRDALPLAPTSLLGRQVQRELKQHRHRFAITDRTRQRHNQRCLRITLITEGERRRRAGFIQLCDAQNVQGWSFDPQRIAGRQPQQLQRFGGQTDVGLGDDIARMSVEDQFARGQRLRIGPGGAQGDVDALWAARSRSMLTS